jgi:hypothetical protein
MTRKLFTTAIALSLAGMTSTFAAEKRSADAQASASQPAPTARDPADPTAAASRLLDNAKRLQEEAEGIASANSEIERRRLLQRHIQTLRAAMMLSAGMMSGDSGQPWMRGGPSGSAGMGAGMGPGMMGMGSGMMGMGPGMMGGGMGPCMMGSGMGPGMRGGGVGPGMLTMMMAMMDTNGDGALSMEEVQAVHARMFNYADSDKDGKLTRDELQGFFRPGAFDSEDD